MEFESEEQAYDFYNTYSRKVGFSVQRQWRNKTKDGVIRDRMFCCSAQGLREKDKRDKNVKRHRPETRTNCSAHMFIFLQPNGKYHVLKFEATHNHAIVTPSKVFMLKSHRSIAPVQAAEIDRADMSGIAPKASMELMGREAGGRENLGFTYVDYKNYLRSKRMISMKKGDAGGVLQYFQNMQLENPSSFYAIQLDEDDLITNIFWATAKMMVDYNSFGDVVCFDTTYKTNKEGRPFALFVGVNHHKQSVIFGAALLYDETIKSFTWLFETSIKAMSGKKPRTMLTDQDAAMAHSISSVMQETYHRNCVWHMYQNAAKRLNTIFQNKAFVKDFSNCVYGFEDEDEFIVAWNNMLQKYDLFENTRLKEKFKEREKWALVYGRQTFCADMSTTQRSESINRLIKRYLDSQKNLLRFFEHFERVLDDRRYEELQADFKMCQSTPILAAPLQILKHAAEVYTPAVFETFQREFLQTWDCDIRRCLEQDGPIIEYKVSFCGSNREHSVTFDLSTGNVLCSCKKFEFVGILCRHALKVFDFRSIRTIPQQYILKRWSKNAKVGATKDCRGAIIKNNPKEEVGRRYKEMCHMLVKVAARASESQKTYLTVMDYADKMLEEVDDSLKRIELDEPSVCTSKEMESQHAPCQNECPENLNAIYEGFERTQEDDISCDHFSTSCFPPRNMSVQAKGIKIRETCRGQRRRYKNVLETIRKKKRIQKKPYSSAMISSSIPCSSFQCYNNPFPILSDPLQEPNSSIPEYLNVKGINNFNLLPKLGERRNFRPSLEDPMVDIHGYWNPGGKNSFSQLLKETIATGVTSEASSNQFQFNIEQMGSTSGYLHFADDSLKKSQMDNN